MWFFFHLYKVRSVLLVDEPELWQNVWSEKWLLGLSADCAGLVCRGSLSPETMAVLPPCSPSLAQLPWLGFALAACGSIQGTVGRLLQWCFVLCPLCGLEFVCHETRCPKYPTSELAWKSHNKKQMPSENSVIFTQGKCSNITQIFVMEKHLLPWKECDVFTDFIFFLITWCVCWVYPKWTLVLRIIVLETC